LSDIEKMDVPDHMYFINHPNSDINKIVIDMISPEHLLSYNWWEKHKIHVPDEIELLKICIVSYVLALKMNKVEKMLVENRNEMAKSTIDEAMTLQIKEKKLLNLRKNLAFKLGRRVIVKY